MDTFAIVALCIAAAAMFYAIGVAAQVNEANRKIKILEQEIIRLKKDIYKNER